MRLLKFWLITGIDLSVIDHCLFRPAWTSSDAFAACLGITLYSTVFDLAGERNHLRIRVVRLVTVLTKQFTFLQARWWNFDVVRGYFGSIKL